MRLGKALATGIAEERVVFRREPRPGARRPQERRPPRDAEEPEGPAAEEIPVAR